jgi:hypothetical protein
MTHQTESESPQPVAEAESLVGVATHALLAVVTEIRRERPRYGSPSATAKVMLYDGAGGQTCVEIPVLTIVDQLDHVSRYLVEIKFRPMAPGEQFDPANAQSQATKPAPDGSR